METQELEGITGTFWTNVREQQIFTDINGEIRKKYSFELSLSYTLERLGWKSIGVIHLQLKAAWIAVFGAVKARMQQVCKQQI